MMDVHVNISGVEPTDKIVKQDNNPKKIVETSLIVIAIVVMGGLLWWAKTYYRGPMGQNGAYEKELPKLSQKSLSKVPAGFPEQYIYGVDAEVLSGSSTVAPGGKTTSMKVDVRANASPRSLFAEYLDMLTKTGWQITSQIISDNVGAISAKNAGYTFLITFEAKNRMTVYHITYVVSSSR